MSPVPAQFALDDDSVVVVIGSGAGGGTLSRRLAERGIKVVCLEAGPRLTLGDIVNDEAAMFPRITWLDERIGQGDAPAAFPTWNCKTVGGTTMHWTAAAPRIQPHEFKARTTYGDLPGTSLADWPLTSAELAPFYDQAEDLMGVTGSHGIPPLPGNANFKVLEAGARRVGYRDVDTNTLAINPVPRDGRAACLQLGFCTSGCATGAKWSTLYTEIPRAEQTGNFELRPQCMAVRILNEQGRHVTGVRYRDSAGKEHVQMARVVCVAGNAVETTRLLLNSGATPAGLANSSDQLGRNYMRHVMAAVIAVMPGAVNMHKGAQVAGVIRDETRHDPGRGFSGGYLMHTLMFSPETLARWLLPGGGWGERLTRALDRYRDMAALLVMGEDLPRSDSRITLHESRRDQHGLPVPVVTYHHHPNSLALRKHSVKSAEKLYRSLGADEIFNIVDVFPATHNMGTARMGEDPSRSVCNSWGQAHDIANLFISDGSVFASAGCENPTLTIVALALRQGDYLAQQIGAGKL